MAKFNIKWSTGKEEQVEQSDCETVEQYVNCRFGRGADLEAFGVEVTLAEEKPKEEKPKEENPKEEKPKEEKPKEEKPKEEKPKEEKPKAAPATKAPATKK